MVTHDVDEALFLSDRVVMMTDGPEAEVGDVLRVNFTRPRERQAVLDHPDYCSLREHMIEFLEIHAHRRPPTASSTPALESIPEKLPAISERPQPLAACEQCLP